MRLGRPTALVATHEHRQCSEGRSSLSHPWERSTLLAVGRRLLVARRGLGARRAHPRDASRARAADAARACALARQELAGFGQLHRVVLRIQHASPELLALAVLFEALSFAGYVALAKTVFGGAAPRIGWRESVEITLAGVVATRLLTAAGVGGIALTSWALRAAGLDGRSAARRLAAFLVVLYAIFFGVLLVDGGALAVGRLGGGAPAGLALMAAAAGGLVLALALATRLFPEDLERRVRRAATGTGPLRRAAKRLAPIPAVAGEAVALALHIVRRAPSTLAAASAWWAFDVAVLWATFEMFGAPPAAGVLVLCYFVGQIAQVIPCPVGSVPSRGA